MARELGVEVGELVGNPSLVSRLDFARFADASLGLGSFTLGDIRAELERPGRDPRPDFRTPQWRADVTSVKDLVAGMELEGRVSNVTNFGAFVDIGVHRDGLVHVSELSHRWIGDPRQAVQVGEIVKVKVLEVDQQRERVALSLKALQPPPASPPPRQAVGAAGGGLPGTGARAAPRVSGGRGGAGGAGGVGGDGRRADRGGAAGSRADRGGGPARAGEAGRRPERGPAPGDRRGAGERPAATAAGPATGPAAGGGAVRQAGGAVRPAGQPTAAAAPGAKPAAGREGREDRRASGGGGAAKPVAAASKPAPTVEDLMRKFNRR
jgi:predicted RNA-binding protein with RPS1 domain